jgi:hypothetical protein
MQMNRVALMASAGLGMAFLAACSDSPTAPTKAAFVPKSSFAVGATPAPTPTAEVGKIIICKTGNVGGTFNFTSTPEGTTVGAALVNPATNVAIGTGTCLEVANDNSLSGSGSHVTVTELAAANTVQTIASCSFRGKNLDGSLNAPESCTYTNGGDLFINSFHGFVITYNNVFTPPVISCTYTKGWYRNKGASTITGVDGLSIGVEGAFFAATPKNTGSVSFVGSNDLLNLYQQLLAALENGGASGPAAVQTAISQAQAGTTVTGTVLTTSLNQTQISALIVTLSSFNEGSLTGYPHCGDEIIVAS